MNSRYFPHILTILGFCTLSGFTPAQSTEILGPETGAVGLVESAVARGAFGPVEVKSRDTDLTLIVDGHDILEPDRIRLVAPGESVELSARLTGNADDVEIPTASDTGYLRTSAYREVVWEGEESDRFEAGADGTVTWKPGKAGQLSYVTASIAELGASHDVAQTAGGGEPAHALLSSGKRGVYLLAGLAFDRGGDGILQGQNIGIYPNERSESVSNVVSRNVEAYAPPDTFYLLNERTAAARITPSLTLGELMPPVFFEDATKDRYVPIDPRILEFWEAFEAVLEEKGLNPEKVSILRGFVSPTDRLRLERQGVSLAEFTRFQYGDAIALVYDPNLKSEEKGQVPPLMGDVDGDGQTTPADVEVLAGYAKEAMDALGKFGGVGIVGAYEGPGASKGTPYLHVDMRGWYAPFRE